MNRKALIWIFFLSLITGTYGNAQVLNFAKPTNVQVSFCKSCDAQQAEAQASALYVGERGTVHVFDINNSNAWQCSLIFHRESFANRTKCRRADNQVASAWSAYIESATKLNATLSLPLDGGDIESIAGCSSCAHNWIQENEQAVADHIRQLDELLALESRLGILVGLVPARINERLEGDRKILVEVSNDSPKGGSKGHCEALLTREFVQINSDKCFDSRGISIASTNSKGIQSRYVFSSLQNHSDMIRALKRAGIQVTDHDTIIDGRSEIRCVADVCTSKQLPDDKK